MSVSAIEVREVVLAHISEALLAKGLLAAEVPDNFDLLLEEVIDSFGLLELINVVESRFDVELDFGELDADDMTTIGPFCRYVAAQSARPATP